MSRNIVTAPIEHFIWTHENSNQDKLIYYDPQGNSFEKKVSHEELEEALKVFNGKKQMIKRSSGGLTLAEPFQLVLFESLEETISRLGVKVRFTDLRRDENNQVIGKEIFLHHKIVLLKDLKQAPVLDLENKEPLFAEFGRGLIPIHVFQYSVDEKGIPQIHFALSNELLKEGEKKIQTYQMIQDGLRIVESSLAETEYKRAFENAEWQLKGGETPIPTCLKTGEVNIPKEATIEMMSHLLRLSINPEGKEYLEPIFINIRKVGEGELIPFGLFE